MKKVYLTVSLFLAAAVYTNAQEATWVFAEQFGSNGEVEPIDVKVDANGDIYVLGKFRNDQLDIGGFTLPYTDGNGKYDGFLCKFNEQGTPLWAKYFAGDHHENPGGIAIDGSNNIYVAGGFRSTTLNFQGESLTLNGENHYDAFIAKYDASGSLIWADSVFWGQDVERLTDIEYDYTNDLLVVAGFFKAEIKYDSAGSVKTINAISDKDQIIAQFSTDGDFIKLNRSYVSIVNTALKNIDLSVIAGNVTGYFVSGDLKGKLYYSATDSISSDDITQMDIMVTKYDDALTKLWGRHGGGTGFEHINNAGSDGFGNIYFTGKASSTTITLDSIGTGSGGIRSQPKAGLGNFDFLVGSYNRDGNLRWFQIDGGSGEDDAFGMSVVGERILYTGYRDKGTSRSRSGFGVYDLRGSVIASDSITGDGDEIGLNVSFDVSADSVLVIGQFDGNQLTAGSHTLNNTFATEYDGFLVKYGFGFNLYKVDSSNISCHGADDGSIIVATEFGTQPITYTWTPDVADTAVASGLAPGIYKIVAEDDEGRKDSVTFSLTEPAAISATENTITSVSCHVSATSGNKNDGAIDIDVAGGTAPHTYLWEPGGQNTQDISGIGKGDHFLTITDANGCVEQDTFNVPEPSAVSHGGSTVDTITIPPGSNGAVHLNTYGGTAPYGFAWTGPGFIPSSEDTIRNLEYGGNYDLTVTDANSCVFDTAFNVPVDTALNIYISDYRDISCRGDNDGWATVAVSYGGSGSYSYAWRTSGGTPVGTNDPTLSGVEAGTYIVKVTDLISSKFAEESQTIAEPATPLVAAVDSVVDAGCFGYADGGVYISVNGGWGDYTYLWTPTSRTAQDLVGVPANSYNVTISDQGAQSGTCVTLLSDIPVGQPEELTVSLEEYIPVSCHGGRGAIEANPGGGTAPYTFLWNDIGSQTDSIAYDLFAGLYKVDVTDGEGCTTDGQFILNQPTQFTLDNILLTHPTAYGLGDGEAEVQASGGTAAYQYRLIDGSFTTDPVFTGLPAGVDTIVAIDANGCESEPPYLEFELIDPPKLVWDSVVITDVPCNGESTGTVCAYASGGVGVLSYQWTGGPSAQCYNSVMAGDYTVTVTDENLISIDTTITISEPDALGLTVNSIVGATCFGDADGAAEITATGGTPSYSYLWSPGGETTAAISGKAAGDYTVTVTDANGCLLDSTITIPGPAAALSLVVDSLVDVQCFGESNGSTSVTPAGGTTPYSYLWSPGGETTRAISGKAAGDYSVTVTDANGCTIDSTLTIDAPAAGVSIVVDSIDHLLCHGDGNGSISVTASGGTGVLSYLWAPGGEMTKAVSGKAGGDYTVTVTDENGCSEDSTISISEPDELVFVSMTPDTITAQCEGTLSVTISGGVPGYTFDLSGHENDQDSTLAAVNYTFAGVCSDTLAVMVIDSNGCSIDSSMIIFTTDVSPRLELKTVLLYPNPSTGRFTMEMQNVDGDLELEIINVTGQLVFKQKYPFDGQPTFRRTIDLGSEARGTYFLRVNGLPVNAKLMIE